MKKRLMSALLAFVCIGMSAGTVLADRVGGQADVYGLQDVLSGANPAYTVSVSVTPVYCFYSAYMKDHFWTASSEEKDQLEEWFYSGKETYQYQGIAGYAEPASTDQNMPVYRFWNKVTTDHFYTTSEIEKEQLARSLDSGQDHYEYEGIAFYVPQISSKPVYRFYDTIAFNHFYTSDEQLKNRLSQAYLNGTGSYRYEGIAWYWNE